MDWRGGLRKTKSLDGRENYTSISIDDKEEEDSNNSLAISFRKQMEEMPEIPSERCIYRVPPSIRVLNEEVYTPQIVSIGPFHHKRKELIGMEEHKLRCMKVFLGQTTTSLDDFIMAIKGFENRARNCYAETINLSIDEFVKILIVDSFFIFEVMIKSATDNCCQDFCFPIPPCFFTTDIILLENQIPFFVLEDLFQLAFPEDDPPYNFLELSTDYISSVVLVKDRSKMFEKVEKHLSVGHKIKHFADLLRMCHLPSPSRITSANKSGEFIRSIPNAVQLQEAGVQLLGSRDCLLDIKYTKGKLEIPVLAVFDSFEVVMSNILTLESCHYLNESYIGHYVFFMQMLVNTDKDADLLIQTNIIAGGSSTMAALFRQLRCRTWIRGPYYLYDTSNNLNTYCNVSRHRWKATFKRDYCSTPWRIASTTAAVILLILTLLSTIAAFLAVKV